MHTSLRVTCSQRPSALDTFGLIFSTALVKPSTSNVDLQIEAAISIVKASVKRFFLVTGYISWLIMRASVLSL